MQALEHDLSSRDTTFHRATRGVPEFEYFVSLFVHFPASPVPAIRLVA